MTCDAPLTDSPLINENMVWTDSQDYGADEILNITGIVLFNKTVG
jgi:hypothetical protein